MRFFINSTSRDPHQKRFEGRPGYQKWGMGLLCLLIGVVMLPLSLVAFIPNFNSIFHIITREVVVNVNYLAFFSGAAFFLSFSFFLMAYSVLWHRRAIVLNELAEPFKTIFTFSFKASIAFLVFVAPSLSIISFFLIRVQGYSWCPKLSNASAWDSWWVIDPLFCQ